MSIVPALVAINTTIMSSARRRREASRARREERRNTKPRWQRECEESGCKCGDRWRHEEYGR